MKAIGVLVIGLGLILIVIGVKGTQSQVLADLKSINPKLRAATGTGGTAAGGAGNTSAGGNATGTTQAPGTTTAGGRG